MSIINIKEIDQKILAPDDHTSCETGNALEVDKLKKSIVGLPKVYNLKTGELIADETNLVVLVGREYIVQKIINKRTSDVDYKDYQIRYFGVGSGGTDSGNTVGPYDNDTDLADKKKIHDGATSDYKYIDSGYLKQIESDGSITIIQEDHTINTADGEETVTKYTAIKFILKINEDEAKVDSDTFVFNEAGLYAVKYSDDDPTDDKILFARFTTTDKTLSANDGILIEWTILV